MGDLIALRRSSGRSASASQRLLRSAAYGKPKRLRLSKDLRADEAFRAILADALGAVSTQAGLLRTGRSAEALHHLRVGLRRVEVMLGAFGKAFGQDWFDDLRSRSKVIAARLAPARDMDVFLGDLWPQAAHDGADFVPLRLAAEASRAMAWEAAEACIASEDFMHFLDDIAALSQSRLPLGKGRGIRPVSRELLAAAAQRVRRRAKRARSRNEADLHALRIGLKKLRYLSQIFAPLHDGTRARPYLKALRQLQEELGQLNDIAHVQTTIAGLMREGDRATIGYGAGLVLGHYGAGRKRAAKKAMKRYRAFADLSRFWKKPR